MAIQPSKLERPRLPASSSLGNVHRPPSCTQLVVSREGPCWGGELWARPWARVRCLLCLPQTGRLFPSKLSGGGGSWGSVLATEIQEGPKFGGLSGGLLGNQPALWGPECPL